MIQAKEFGSIAKYGFYTLVVELKRYVSTSFILQIRQRYFIDPTTKIFENQNSRQWSKSVENFVLWHGIQIGEEMRATSKPNICCYLGRNCSILLVSSELP